MGTRKALEILRMFGLVVYYPWFCAIVKIWNFVNIFITKRKVSKVDNQVLLLSAVSLAKKIRDKELTSESVVQMYIDRCQLVNPLINAIAENNFENALNEARCIDKLIANGQAPDKETAPFLGVPFSAKDHMFVNGMLCTAGIPNRRNRRMFEDSECIRLMKEAGAIVLCVTNVSEVCMWLESNNTIYGRTNNPYDTRRIAGGSSGGQGALIGAAGVPFGIGSDVAGSIRMPSYFNGIFGHKTSPNIVNDKGNYPTTRGYQREMYALGPMCRYAEDLKPILKVLAGENVSMLGNDKEIDISKLRIFYMYKIDSVIASPVDRELKESILKVTRHFQSKYDTLSFKLDLEFFRWALAIWFTDMDVKGAPSFAQEMCNLEGDISPILELLKWIVGQSEHTYPSISLALVENMMKKLGNEEERQLLVHLRKTLCRQFESLLGDDGVFLFPPHPVLTQFHNQPCMTPFNFQYTAIFNSLGLPVTSCPLGLSREGTPLGVQVVGARNRDYLTIAVAQELEKAFGGWVQP